jgi:competence protein ComEA
VDSYFRELFTFTRGEKKGLLILTGIIFLLLLTLLLIPVLFKDSESTRSDWIREMSRLDLKDKDELPALSDSITEIYGVPPERELFEFDPNLASEQNLQALGLTSWQIRIIEKYRNRGGKFRNAQDFGKIYGIGQLQFEALKPYIHIQSNLSASKKDTGKFLHNTGTSGFISESALVEINGCDSITLDKLPGIGKFLAARIVKYRDRLGGFIRLDQLKEVYGLKAETYSGLCPRLRIDTTLVHKLKLNSIVYGELRKHPYITPFQAKSLIKYRELRGNFKEDADLELNNLFSKEDLTKIKPYISLE